MRRFGIYFTTVLAVTIILPTIIVKTFKFVPRGNSVIGEAFQQERIVQPREEEKEEKLEEKKPVEVKISDEYKEVKLYNPRTKTVEEIDLEEYIKRVVTAEMPAAFHMEALKAQAVAARTYAISRSIRYADGHPDHKEAALCTTEHCQAYLSLAQISDLHGEKWMEDYWPKIEEAVESTKGLGIYYKGEITEPLYHSTSGGQTEDIQDVFASDTPYLKSVPSPNEEEAPRYRSIETLTVDEFIGKIQSKYPQVKIDKENITDKIKLIEKTPTGRVKKVAIDGELVSGSEIRDLFSLNSTNFTISLDSKFKIIEIETYGYGHGVGMSQWGANSMGKEGKNFEEILKHYYTGVEIKPLQ